MPLRRAATLLKELTGLYSLTVTDYSAPHCQAVMIAFGAVRRSSISHVTSIEKLVVRYPV